MLFVYFSCQGRSFMLFAQILLQVTILIIQVIKNVSIVKKLPEVNLKIHQVKIAATGVSETNLRDLRQLLKNSMH